MTRATRTSKGGPDIRAALAELTRVFTAYRDPAVPDDDISAMFPVEDAAVKTIAAAHLGPELGFAKLRIVLRRLEGDVSGKLGIEEDDYDVQTYRLLASAIEDLEEERSSLPSSTKRRGRR